MARKRKPPAAPAAPATPAGAEFETRDYPPELVARRISGEDPTPGAPLPTPPEFGHFTDPGLGAAPSPATPPAPETVPSPEAPPPGPAAALPPPPPSFGHFTDPGLLGGPTILPAQESGPKRTLGSSFLLAPFASEPKAPAGPDSAEVARLPQKPLPAYLLHSDEVEAHPPMARRLQMAWLAASLALIGGSLYLLLRPGPRPAAGSAAAYELEAKKGDVHAMRTLGTWYTYGLNVPRDPVKGKAWYRKAAEAGDPVAEQELAAVEAGEKK